MFVVRSYNRFCILFSYGVLLIGLDENIGKCWIVSIQTQGYFVVIHDFKTVKVTVD
jgi:hypothetical protein